MRCTGCRLVIPFRAGISQVTCRLAGELTKEDETQALGKGQHITPETAPTPTSVQNPFMPHHLWWHLHQVCDNKQVVAGVQAQVCLSYMQVLLLFFPFGLHMFSGVTSVVILRNSRMEKINLIVKHLHFLKSKGMAYFSFS